MGLLFGVLGATLGIALARPIMVGMGYEGDLLRKSSDALYDLEWVQPTMFTPFTFAASDFQFNGVVVTEKTFPVVFEIAGIFYKKFAGIEFGFSPLLFTHSHIITEKTQYFDYIYY